MAAYACTECGRCTSECPANLTGKKLSPRKIMMDTRDRMEDVRAALKQEEKVLTMGRHYSATISQRKKSTPAPAATPV